MYILCRYLIGYYIYIYLVIFAWVFFVNYTFKLSMYIAHTVPGRYTLIPLSLVLYLEEEEDGVDY